MPHPWKLTTRLLLSVYGLLPLALLIVFVDQVFLYGAIRDYLQLNFRDLAFITVILNLPHIVASHVTLFDRDYVTHYKGLLAKAGTLAVALGTLLPIVFGMKIFFVFMASYTMYHVLAQQFGLSLMFMSARPNTDFKGWLWTTTLGYSIGYLIIYHTYYFTPDQVKIAKLVMLAGFALSGIFALRLMRIVTPEKTPISRWYFYANIMMGFVCFILFTSGYAFFTVLIPRFVHDLTAFAVYIVHDHNRNEAETHNYFYMLLDKLHLKPWVACMPLAIGIAWVLTVGSEHSHAVMYFTFSIIFLHFIIEGRIWKAGTPHRDSLPIVKN